MMQFSLISLIPGLLRNLQDSAGPDMNSYEKQLSRPTSLRTSDRNSLLAYMGLPLQIFGKVMALPRLIFELRLMIIPGKPVWALYAASTA